MNAAGHRPVMLAEVLELLGPRDGGLYLDGTFGAGGYARALLEAADCAVFALDRDPEAIGRGAAVAALFPGRLTLIEGRFSAMERLLAPHGVSGVDGVALDLGLSSVQIETPERGFSFRLDGPLDMRMGRSGPTAADLVNALPEDGLADILWRYGEERLARKIARAIVAARAGKPIARTLDLAALVHAAVGGRGRRDGIDPATRTFQALRIAANDELAEIEAGLAAAERLLRPRGRLVVVSFHSLEDRRVKEFLSARSGEGPAPSRHLPAAGARARPSFRRLTRKPLRPGAAEVAENPRARSARLRAAERTEAPAWGARGPAPMPGSEARP
ncbi:MAG: 16S rRNA (cytosine(1402)-N(4))-methyltransferase RsmH [Proteobacteria bacterium]|nr:16S rRNA (cytosine(1402)-N(4))-methyltransferase RsmH [Pseudomonadota bacterium]